MSMNNTGNLDTKKRFIVIFTARMMRENKKADLKKSSQEMTRG